MKKSLFIFSPLLVLSIVLMTIKNSFSPINGPDKTLRIANILSCGPVSDDGIVPDENGKFITILPGWGNHQYTITTQSDSAQLYFNQGLSMYYSYHMKEAVASFREAARLDSSCAMAFWGQALALGPTYNRGYQYKISEQVFPVLTLMNRFSRNTSPKEKRLIEAMNQRYNPADAADKRRAAHNQKYATAMHSLVAAYPHDLDIKALYVDATMLLHPWEFWNNDGSPKPWTAELVQYSEDVLRKDPRHPAALHYHIHLTEASRRPEVALASADSLQKLFPGVAHMVHMSSHEYERIGDYARGVQSNEAADNTLGRYSALAKNLSLSEHVPHYFAVEAYCALSGAMYSKGLPKAVTCRQHAAPSHEGTYQQYLYMYPLFAMVRMGKWQEILKDTSFMDASWTYAQLLNHFAKGMAYAKTGDPTQAQMHLAQLRQQQQDSILQVPFTPYMSSAYDCALVAENILAATIFRSQKNNDAAISSLKKAILAEDSLLYSEPRIWMLPARQYLGALLLELNQPKEAEEVYREDLVWNPGNGWSVVGLYKALQAQRKKQDLAGLKKQYTYSFSKADVIPPGSAY